MGMYATQQLSNGIAVLDSKNYLKQFVFQLNWVPENMGAILLTDKWRLNEQVFSDARVCHHTRGIIKKKQIIKEMNNAVFITCR